MTRHYYRVHGVHSVTIGETGHTHDTVEISPLGDERLTIDCAACEPYLHPMDWSPRPADILKTWDEVKAEVEAEERSKQLGPNIAEIVARVTAEAVGVSSRARALPDPSLAIPGLDGVSHQDLALALAIVAEMRKRQGETGDVIDLAPSKVEA